MNCRILINTVITDIFDSLYIFLFFAFARYMRKCLRQYRRCYLHQFLYLLENTSTPINIDDLEEGLNFFHDGVSMRLGMHSLWSTVSAIRNLFVLLNNAICCHMSLRTSNSLSTVGYSNDYVINFELFSKRWRNVILALFLTLIWPALLICVADEGSNDKQYSGQHDGSFDKVEKLNSKFYFRTHAFVSDRSFDYTIT